MAYSIIQPVFTLWNNTKSQRKYVLLLMGLVFISVQTLAQQPPTGHAAIWKNVREYWDLWAARDLDGFMAFHHAGYSGWFHDSPAHRGKKITRRWMENRFEELEVTFYEVNAIDIKIHDHSAIAHYYLTFIERDSKGQEHKRTFRRTDFLLREEEKWMLVAHHDNLE